jgi:hypothetical protein
MERTAERAATESQAAHALQRMLSRIAVEPGDKIAISIHVSTPNGGTVTDRAIFHAVEQPRK